MELLKEAQELMGIAEQLLGDSSRGRALETEKDLIEKLKQLDPTLAQKAILEKIGRLVEKAEKPESDVIGKLDEVIRKAKSSSGNSHSPGSQQKPGEAPKSPRKPGDPVGTPYDPKRIEDASKFRSRADKAGSWSHLPPAARAAMLAGEKAELPPEFLQQWKEYSEMLQRQGK